MRNILLSFYLLLFFMAPALSIPGSAAASSLPETLPLNAMIGQMVMVGFRGIGDTNEPEMRTVLEDVMSGRIGGVIYFERDWQTKKRGRNIVTLEQTARLSALLQKAAPIPLFIAVDQEGGRVQRLKGDHGFPETPTAEEMGKRTPGETKKTALIMGRNLKKIGINVNFAPVADIAVNPKSPAIGGIGRAFSADPNLAANHAKAFMSGLNEAGVIGSYKHFPGHGSSVADSHKKLTDVTETWSEAELIPYKNLPQNAPFMVMTGHLMHKKLDAKYPASLSRAITAGLLREKLGWQGVVVTDDLEMDAIALFYSEKERVRLAIEAGVDIILFGNNLKHAPEQGRKIYGIIKTLVSEGTVSQERIAESWKRIRALKTHMTAR